MRHLILIVARQVVIVSPQSAQGWLEPPAMDSALACLMEALQRRDAHGRLAIYHLYTSGGDPIYVHARVTIIDDTIIRGGGAPFPVPAHQTGRADFRHPAFRLVSPHSFRWGPNVSIPEPHNPAISIDKVIGEAASAAPRLIVPPRKEVSNALIDMMIDRPVRL